MSLNIQEKDPVTGELKRKVVAGNGGGTGLPEPESKDKLLLSTENEETSELEWSQVDRSTVGDSPFKGTEEEWNALSDDEKAKFQTVIFTDDYDKPNMKFPDYAHPLTMNSTTWVATQDVFINVLQVNTVSIESVTIDGASMGLCDSVGSAYTYAWSGYVRKGQTIKWHLLNAASRCQVYPLV